MADDGCGRHMKEKEEAYVDDVRGGKEKKREDTARHERFMKDS